MYERRETGYIVSNIFNRRSTLKLLNEIKMAAVINYYVDV
jgi:hypothetical protein